jgi:hypothetical protein
MAKRTLQPLIPESKLNAVLTGLLAVPKAEVDAAVAKPVRKRKLLKVARRQKAKK